MTADPTGASGMAPAGGGSGSGGVSWRVMSEFRCPICKRPTAAGGVFFPFCSKRCKYIDLGAWIDERYRIERPLREEERDPEAFGDLPPPAEGRE